MKRVTGGTPWHDGNIHGFFQPFMERPTVMAIYQLEALRKPIYRMYNPIYNQLQLVNGHNCMCWTPHFLHEKPSSRLCRMGRMENHWANWSRCEPHRRPADSVGLGWWKKEEQKETTTINKGNTYVSRLVLWNMNFICPYIGNNNPIWLIFFQRGRSTTNHHPVSEWKNNPIYGS